jgi:ribosome-associated heat shock protein Hsp15
MIEGGKVRVNARVVRKPAAPVGAGDVLTLVQGDAVRVVRVLGLPSRRGPAAEAQALYEESQERGVNSG